jgi:hypothetical protein
MPRINLEVILNGAVNSLSPECFFKGKGRNERLHVIGNCAKLSGFIIITEQRIFSALLALAIKILIANNCTRWREIVVGLSKDGEQADFVKNLRNSLFSIHTRFSHFYLD